MPWAISARQNSQCSSLGASSYVGIAADGEVYPCFRHLGLKDYHLGNVVDGLNDSKRMEFRSKEAADVDNRPGCQSCWARYICGGGCYADSVVYGPDKLATPQNLVMGAGIIKRRKHLVIGW